MTGIAIPSSAVEMRIAIIMQYRLSTMIPAMIGMKKNDEGQPRISKVKSGA